MFGRQQPTRRQLEVLRAYIAAGSIAGAAYELGISETTARQHLSGLYRRTGCLNAAQAAYLLGACRLDGDAGHELRQAPDVEGGPPLAGRASWRRVVDLQNEPAASRVGGPP
jgi:DNA-binding CsgD family transcriptional regulator